MPIRQAIIHGESIHSSTDQSFSMVEMLAKQVELNPHGCLWEFDRHNSHRSSSYQKLWNRSGLISAALIQQGIERGTPIVLLLDSVLDFIPAIWACFRSDLLAVPLSSLAQQAVVKQQTTILSDVLSCFKNPVILGDAYFKSICSDLAKKYQLRLLFVESLEDKFATSDRQQQPHDLTCLISTSGSTGQNKLVSLTNRSMANRFFASSPNRKPKYNSNRLHWLPFDSVTGLRVMTPASVSDLYIDSKTFFGRPLTLFDAIDHFKITDLAITSSAAQLINEANDQSKQSWDLSSLVTIVTGAETVVPSILSQFLKTVNSYGSAIDSITAGYGTTETGLITSGLLPSTFLSDSNLISSASLGNCAAETSLRITGENDQTILEGETGHIQVRSPLKIFSGYYGEDCSLDKYMTDDGWFRTGDMGYLRKGELTITGRSKEIIIVNAKKYAFSNIESAILMLPGVTRNNSIIACSVRPDNLSTEELAIFFVPHNFEESTLRKFVVQMRHQISKEFGISLKYVIPLTKDQIPRTTTGKVHRLELVSQLLKGALSPYDNADSSSGSQSIHRTPGSDMTADIKEIWQQVLTLDHLPSINTNFFDLGGNSLQLFQLTSRLEEKFGRSVPLRLFIQDPTVGTLIRIIQNSDNSDVSTHPLASHWPLPPQLDKKIRDFIETWDGEPASHDRLIIGLNTQGKRLPLFWVFQENQEFSQLARHLGPDQPVYGMRSGHLIMEYNEDNIQALALRYTHDILDICPDDPIILGGNCQGGIIALAIAQHLARRKHHLPLLILMEWGFVIQPYYGRVLLLSGTESPFKNSYQRYCQPEIAWRRAFPEYSFEYISGEHGRLFDEPDIDSLAATLGRHLSKATSSSPRILPYSAYSAQIELIEPLLQMNPAEKRVIRIMVKNSSTINWRAAEDSGLMLASQWVNTENPAGIYQEGRAALPKLNAGESAEIALPIEAPDIQGVYQVVFDVVEEGSTWFEQMGSTTLKSKVLIFRRMSEKSERGESKSG